MTSEEEREKRLQHRFNAIVEAVTLNRGKDYAFACACAAYLMAIETAVVDDFGELCENDDRFKEKSEALRRHLQIFHKYICNRLKVSQNDVLDTLPSFKEILRDIMRGKG